MNNQQRGSGGGSRGGRGGGRGCGRGRGGKSPTDTITTSVLCLGCGTGYLAPYTGGYDDARLKQFRLFQVCGLPVESQTEVDLSAALRQPQHAEVTRRATTPGTRWRAQFGTQIVYFGHSYGLPSADADETARGVKTEQQLKELIGGHNRSSFAARQFSVIADVVAYITEKMAVQFLRQEHILRFVETIPGSHQLLYERVAATREQLLDKRQFNVAAFDDGMPLCNLVVVLPSTGREKSGEGVPHFRNHVLLGRKYPGKHRNVEVRVDDGTVSVRFCDETATPSYVRVQERYVLQVKDSSIEVHVMANEEYGPTVAPRQKNVRVELHCELPNPTYEDWKLFTSFATLLAPVLNKFA